MTGRLRFVFVFLGLSLISFCSHAQFNLDFQLGVDFYQKGEFEKSRDQFERLYEKEPEQFLYYQYYFQCLYTLKDFEKAAKIARSGYKRHPDNQQYGVDWMVALKASEKKEKAEEVMRDLLSSITDRNIHLVFNLANAFKVRQEYSLAETVLLKAKGNPQMGITVLHELAELAFVRGDRPKMAEYYLELVEAQGNQLPFAQNMLQARLNEDDYEALRKIILDHARRYPDNIALTELMVWYFVQQRDFSMAFVQAKALDKRVDDNGVRILNLARSARENQDLRESMKMYEYLVGKGSLSALYRTAKAEYLDVKAEAELQSDTLNDRTLQELGAKYREYLQEFGLQSVSMPLIQGYARILAEYQNKANVAADFLDSALLSGVFSSAEKAQLKMQEGDYLVMIGEVWEPTLLYGQVEKDFKDDPIGQEAKFRNARLSYYRGEFEWAFAQLDVLKGSTSQWISNDAIALSLVIQESLGTDSNAAPLLAFSRAELLRFGRKYKEATSIYDSILKVYAGHPLQDDALYSKAETEMTQKHYSEAATLFEKVFTDFPSEVLADDALFRFGKIQEERLNDKDKAYKAYDKLLELYPGSTFTVEARRRFRSLRGDHLN